MKLLLCEQSPFRLVHIEQWRFAAAAVKPTTLLTANLRLEAHLAAAELPAAVKPLTQLIGRAKSGEFNTAKAKEYPPRLCRAFASAMLAQKPLCEAAAPAWIAQLFEFSQISAEIRGHRQPDYQPH